MLMLFVIVLYALNIPQDIQTGVKGQIAIKELDGMRHPLLKIKATASRFHFDQNVSAAKIDLEKLDADSKSCIHHYKIAADYNNVLSKTVADFTIAYNRWIKAELQYLAAFAKSSYMQSDDIAGLSHEHYLVLKSSENNALFLSVMQLLADGEEPIHDDIIKGRHASHVLQWATASLAIYFFVIIFLFQRASGREHLLREKNLEITLKSIGDAVIATDMQGHITRMNPEAERLTGWTIETAKGCALSKIFKVINESSGELVTNQLEQVKQEVTKTQAVDLVLIALDGSRYQIHENIAAIHDDLGGLTGLVLVFSDITHAHELKNRLDENANRLKRVIDSSIDAVVVIDELGMVKEWNPAAEVMFGWSFEEITKQPIHESIIPEEFRQQHLQGIQQLIKNNRPETDAKRIESVGQYRDGHTFPIELAMTYVQTQNGWVFNAFMRDISAQKHKEILLKKNELLLRESQRIAKLGYWDLDLKNDVLQWSDEIYRIFCINPVDFKPSYELFINFVHPKDRERVDAAYSQSLKDKTLYNIVHRIVTDEGIKIVHQQCDTSFDKEGNPVHSLGLMQDITEHANNMEELRLAATMFKSHTGILITETDGTILRVNPAFEEMTGYTSKELVGKNPRILQSGKQDKAFYRNMWAEVAREGTWQGELCNKRKDGSEYIEWLTLTAVSNDVGEVTHYVGTSQDITERKNTELQIEYLAYHDDLTSLANRRLLYDRLHQNIAACKRHNEYGAVLLLDLDHFKDLNDSLGHSVGDEILCQVALRLKEIVRDEDTVARLGGDEFVIVLSSVGGDLSTLNFKVQAIAEKIRMSLLQPYRQKKGQCYSSVSIGISLFPENTEHGKNVGEIEDII
ncbi:MAG: PAS domain S-box protein, partial [Gammaproteobacteria bacterium]|nr:PAS domain S-box protein [Gammaproteobacteria bacterium]